MSIVHIRPISTFIENTKPTSMGRFHYWLPAVQVTKYGLRFIAPTHFLDLWMLNLSRQIRFVNSKDLTNLHNAYKISNIVLKRNQFSRSTSPSIHLKETSIQARLGIIPDTRLYPKGN